jgi:hypothetical protein
MKKASHYLKLVQHKEVIIIPACKGGQKANFAYAEDVFTQHIDPDINSYKINLAQPATSATEVEIYEMFGEDTDFHTLFHSLSSDLRDICFKSQEQIIKFAQTHKMKLYEFGNLFLFSEREKFYVANIDTASGGLWLNVYLLTQRRGRLLADIGYRVIVPKYKQY